MASPAQALSSADNAAPPGLKRTLGLGGLILYGIIVIQPIAAMSPYGLVSTEAHGHVLTAMLAAMIAMVPTALSYGRMARAYPSAGSAFTYVTNDVHPMAGLLTGLSMALDYMVNPLICTILSSKLMHSWVPGVPYAVWAVFFAGLFTALNLVGVKTSAKINALLTAAMGIVILIIIVAGVRYVMSLPSLPAGFFTRPLYDPAAWDVRAILRASAIAALTFIGFDGISTLSEEVENPRRNVLLATVLTCIATGVVGALYVYPAQLAWPEATFPDPDTAYPEVARRMGGTWLFNVVNGTLLVATIGSGIAALLGAARLLYGMGRDNALPRSFFGYVNETGIPRNNVLLVGGIVLVGAYTLDFGLGVDLLMFGALIAFMGVNAAAFMHYVVRKKERGISMVLPPIAGFALCLYLWVNISNRGLIGGFVWLALGLAYGLYVKRKTGKLSFGDI
jgi:putrescine importer